LIFFDFLQAGMKTRPLAFSGEQFKDTVNTQTMWRIGYAKRLRIFDIGATLKWLRYSTKVLEEIEICGRYWYRKTITKKSETNRSLGLSYGLSIANVVQTTVSIQGLEKMPLIIRGGFAVSTNEIAKAGYNDNLLIETGFAIRDSIVNPAVGIQYTLPQGLSFRFGQSTKFSVGAGWDLGEMKINYAYIPMTKHSVIDFAYSFGPGTIGQKENYTN